MKISSRIPVFLFLIFAICPLLSAEEEGGDAVIAEKYDMQYRIDRFHDQVRWIKAVARDTKNFDLDIMFVGDSITHRWEKAGKDVWTKYYGNRRAFNFGTGGDRTGNVIWRLQNAPMDKIRPKMIVLMIGTNNRTKPSDTVLGIKKIVGMLKNYYPAAKILLLEVFSRGEKADSGGRRTVNAINEGLRKEYANSDQ
ncbi:MAG: GDSL-type esterase/lipase family protein, partial [Planctomycetia bacterium]|nr:GDSL-type esterase/lipase family protein [Planctomycetia bacterium]